MTKTKTITVTRGERSRFDDEQRKYVGYIAYRVEQITNSIEFYPEQMLTPETVQELCDPDDWKVIVKGGGL